MRILSIGLYATALLAATTAPVLAHDFWLSGVRIGDGAPALRMQLGDELLAEETRGYEAAKTTSFRLLTADGERDLATGAVDGAVPFRTLPADTQAPALAVLDRNPIILSLDAPKFADYLREEHLERLLDGRNTLQGPQRERYTRHIKWLFAGNTDETSVHARVAGEPLEIVLLDAPGTPATGKTLRARVLFEGKPLAGSTLTILHDDDTVFDRAVTPRTAVTDAEGVAKFAYDAPGFWLLRMVHMQPCDGCSDADWRSWWAAYAIQTDLPAAAETALK